jgi:arginase
MPIDLITVPYDSGHRAARMGAGPLRFLEDGAAERLRAAAGAVRETMVGVEPELATETAVAFDLARATAFAVRAALGRGSFPLVLAGNCITSLGVMSALSGEPTGIVWLDAHGDLNTPETTTSGMLDGMALSTVLGRCWTAMSARVDGFVPVPEEHVLLVGARDLDEPEQYYLDRSRILALAPDDARDGHERAWRLDALAGRVRRVYLHGISTCTIPRTAARTPSSPPAASPPTRCAASCALSRAASPSPRRRSPRTIRPPMRMDACSRWAWS